MVKVIEIYKFKSKKSEINAAQLILGNDSKGFSAHNTKKTGLYKYIYYFPVDYDSIDVADILNIHKYLTKKTLCKIMIAFIKNFLLNY